MSKLKLIILFIFFVCCFANAQERTGLFAYNVGLGAVFSGVGAVINKEPQEKFGKTFFNGFWKGAIGGYLVYESKNLIGEIPNKQEWTYSGGAKILNAAGTSIIENGASNRKAWEQWYLHIGFNRIEFYTQDKFSVKYRIMPISFILTSISAINSKMEFQRSFHTGEIIFSKSRIRNAAGRTNGNVIILESSYMNNYNLYAHELIHVYQYYDYNFVNMYINKPKKRWREKSKIYKKFSDIFYFDAQGIVLRSLYLLEGGRHNDYHYDNFFEYEAEFFSSKGNVRKP